MAADARKDPKQRILDEYRRAGGGLRGVIAAAEHAGVEAALVAVGVPPQLVPVVAPLLKGVIRLQRLGLVLAGSVVAGIAFLVAMAMLVTTVVDPDAGVLRGGTGTLSAAAGVGSPYVDGVEATIFLPESAEQAYRVAASVRPPVPWTILAAIAQLATQHGKVSPYDDIDRDPTRSQLPDPVQSSAVTQPGFRRPPVVSDNRVFLIGDSLGVGTDPRATELLEANGWQVTSDSRTGRRLAEAAAVIADHADRIGGTVVLALGTNDTPGGFDATLDQVLGLLAGSRVLMFTIYNEQRPEVAVAVSDAIRAATTRHANLQVIEWNPDPRTVVGHFHYNDAGYAARAELLARTIGVYSGPTASASSPTPLRVPGADLPDNAVALPGRTLRDPGATSAFPVATPPIGDPEDPARPTGPMLVYPAAVAGRDVDLQDLSANGRGENTATEWVAAELQRIWQQLLDEGRTPENYDAIVGMWVEAVRRLRVADPLATECDAALPPDPTGEQVAIAIDAIWSCELMRAAPFPVPTGTSPIDGAQFVREAHTVAWAFSRWGQEACDPDADLAGVFPLERQIFEDHRAPTDAARDRCDPIANVRAAVRAFIAFESVPPGTRDRPASGPAATIGGWLAMPWALGDETARQTYAQFEPSRLERCRADITAALTDATRQFAARHPAAITPEAARTAAADPAEVTHLDGALAALRSAAAPCAAAAGGAVDAVVIAAIDDETATQRAAVPPEGEPAPEGLHARLAFAEELGSRLRGPAEAERAAGAPVPGQDAVVARLDLLHRQLETPPPPPGNDRLSWAAQVVTLAQMLGGVTEDDPVFALGGTPWIGVETPLGIRPPAAVRVGNQPTGQALAFAAQRYVGLPASGTGGPDGFEFVRRVFTLIGARLDATDPDRLFGQSVAVNEIAAGDVVVLDVAGQRVVAISTSPLSAVTALDDEPAAAITLDLPQVRFVRAVRVLPTFTLLSVGNANGAAGAVTLNHPDPAVQAAWVKWGASFVAAGQAAGVDPLLVFAFAWQESGFSDKNVYCRDGRHDSRGNGIMQFQPATARSWGVDDACVPEQAIPGGARFIKALLDRYGGDVKWAAVAYNGGPAVGDAARDCNCIPSAAVLARWYGGFAPTKYRIIVDYASAGADPMRGVPGKYESLKAHASYTSAGTGVAGACPMSAPAGTLRDGADQLSVHDLCVRSAAQAPTPAAAAAVVYTFNHLGVPYSNTPKRNQAGFFDCSSFVSRAYQEGAGVRFYTGNAPTTAVYLSGPGYVRRISPDEVLPGDLVFPHPGHMGMALADGWMIHTNRTGDVSHIRALYPPASMYAALRFLPAAV